MIFKRNAKGLLEREVTTPSMQEPAHFTPAQNNMIRQDMQRQPPALNQEKKEIPVSSLSPSMTSSYPQEDFPSYVHGNQEPPASEYMQDMEQAASDYPETTLGEGVSFKGELAFKRYLCINGEFEGVLSSSGKLRVGKTGFVKSNLKLKSAIIEGRVEGDIVVEDLLELRGSACVRGNITARYLRVDDGVTLIGHVNICPEGQQAGPHAMAFEAQG
jgi:cytoskeletal protein CcmA (bactofilin family)